MNTPAVKFYDVAVFLHILCGRSRVRPDVRVRGVPRGCAAVGTAHLPGVRAGILAKDRRLVRPSVVIILATGVYLAADPWDFNEFFVTWGLVAVLFLFGLAHGYIPRNATKASGAAERDSTRPSGADEFGPGQQSRGKLQRRPDRRAAGGRPDGLRDDGKAVPLE